MNSFYNTVHYVTLKLVIVLRPSEIQGLREAGSWFHAFIGMVLHKTLKAKLLDVLIILALFNNLNIWLHLFIGCMDILPPNMTTMITLWNSYIPGIYFTIFEKIHVEIFLWKYILWHRYQESLSIINLWLLLAKLSLFMAQIKMFPNCIGHMQY